jgi:hypothetical protein
MIESINALVTGKIEPANILKRALSRNVLKQTGAYIQLDIFNDDRVTVVFLVTNFRFLTFYSGIHGDSPLVN